MLRSLLIACCLVVCVLGEASDIIVLTDSNWKGMIEEKQGAWLLEFYAPWCGHCKKLEPIYEDLAGRFAGSSDHFVAKIDATQNTEISELFEVGGYPTIVAVANGKVYQYAGERTAGALEAFLQSGWQQQTTSKPVPKPVVLEGPSAVVQLTDSTIDRVTKGDWMIKFYAPWCGHCKKIAPQWELAARQARDAGLDVQFADVDCTVHSLTAKRFGVTAYPTLIRTSGGKMLTYPSDSPRDAEGLVKFNVDGVWEEKWSSAVDIPEPPGLMDEVMEVLEMTKNDLQVLWDMKKLAIAVVFGGGVLFGAALVAILTPTPKPRKLAAGETKKAR